ncbi:MAG TPA: hypothetical protein PLN02_13930, partial [Azonexus sp.]|nr:hypothetical protein [Azonexus sp.]
MRMVKELVLLSMLLCAAQVPAQETGERRGPPPGVSRGDYAGPRPPADASDEEKRAFWRARAAERRQAETAPLAAEAAAPAAEKAPPAADARPGKPAAGQAPAARAQAVDPHAGHTMPMAAPPAPAAAASGRPRGMRGGGDGVLWLSDQAPRRDGGGRPGGARGGNPMAAMGGAGGMDDMGMGGAPGRVPNKRLWL